MPRHQRQTKQQFVLNEVANVERPREDKNVVFAVGIQLRGGVFIDHEKKGPLSLHRSPHWVQATLAFQPNMDLGMQVQPHLLDATTKLAQFTACTPSHEV